MTLTGCMKYPAACVRLSNWEKNGSLIQTQGRQIDMSKVEKKLVNPGHEFSLTPKNQTQLFLTKKTPKKNLVMPKNSKKSLKRPFRLNLSQKKTPKKTDSTVGFIGFIASKSSFKSLRCCEKGLSMLSKCWWTKACISWARDNRGQKKQRKSTERKGRERENLEKIHGLWTIVFIIVYPSCWIAAGIFGRS